MKRLHRLDAWLTKAEVALALVATASLVLALCAWVLLKGLSARTTDVYFAGAAVRMLALAAALGSLAHRVVAKRAVTTVAVLMGVTLGWLGRGVGVAWSENLLGWLQDGSTLTLFGGLRGLGTRLTLVVVLAGAALATSTGRHVSIDVASRALPDGLKRWARRVGGVLAAGVCIVSAWGFFDFIAIDAFKATTSSRMKQVASELSADAFLLRRQLVLDVTVAPRVLKGERWDSALTGDEWNAWLSAGAWSTYFNAETSSQLAESAPTHPPLITVPGGSARGLLVKPLALVLPLGLLWLALRFLLWVLRGAPGEHSPSEAQPGRDTPVSAPAQQSTALPRGVDA